MIYLKHYLLMSLMLISFPLFSRWVTNRINRKFGMALLPYDWSFWVQCFAYGLTLPLVAQGAFDLLFGWGVGGFASRLISLGLVGLIYGFFFAIQPYFHKIWSFVLGIAGGLVAATLYHYLPYNFAMLALVIAVLAVMPILALELPKMRRRRVVRNSPEAVPIRGYHS